jgi:membrane protease YdiL (CAAX protease family)
MQGYMQGYMLRRLIDAGVPKPTLASGIIWALWHVPLILGGVYLAGVSPLVAASLWIVVAAAASLVLARIRLATGSIWPPIICMLPGTAPFKPPSMRQAQGPGRCYGLANRESSSRLQ